VLPAELPDHVRDLPECLLVNLCFERAFTARMALITKELSLPERPELAASEVILYLAPGYTKHPRPKFPIIPQRIDLPNHRHQSFL